MDDEGIKVISPWQLATGMVVVGIQHLDKPIALWDQPRTVLAIKRVQEPVVGVTAQWAEEAPEHFFAGWGWGSVGVAISISTEQEHSMSEPYVPPSALIEQLQAWMGDDVATTVVFNFGGNLVSVTTSEWVWSNGLLSAQVDPGRGPYFFDHTAIVAMVPIQGDPEKEWGILPESFDALMQL